MKSKVGPKICFEIQNVAGNRGRKGKPNNSLRMGSNKERYGPHLEGDSTHASGQIQGVFAGSSYVNIGEQSARPTERYYPTFLRADCKGRIGGKSGSANPSCSGSKEREVSVAEVKGSQETTSTQGQRCRDEGDEGRNSCAPENGSPSGKIMEKIPYVAELECDGEKVGSHLAAADSSGNDLRDYVQAGEKSKSSSRDLGMKLACLRVEDEGEDDIRAERSVNLDGKGRGNIDGTRDVSLGREHLYCLDSQAVKLLGSGQIFGVGRGSGHVLGLGLGSCRVLGSFSDLGQNSRATQCPDSFKRAHLNGLTLHEPTCFKAQAEILKTGLSQDLFSTSAETPERLEPISCSSEAGQEGNASSLGEDDEPSEVAAQAEGYNLKKRYDDNLIIQSTSIPFSVFGRPLLSGGFSGRGDSLLEKAVPLRVVAADGREWGSESPGGISEEGEETGVVGQRKEAQCESIKNWNYGSWVNSCLVIFSEFLGFPTKGFEKEILNLLRNFGASQKLSKEKGSLTVSKSERELRRLRSTINYNGNKINKGGGRDRGNLLIKLK